MGRENNIINSYLATPDKFEDFFNAVCFEGAEIIYPECLSETSEKYDISPAENPNNGERMQKEERIRDIKKLYNGGNVLRVLAIENQSYIDYTACVRNMQYDAMEYAGQLKLLKTAYKGKNKIVTRLAEQSEVLSGVSKSDRLHPAYTIWFYYGEEKWNGPKSLKDMMDFGDDADGMSEFFNDYKLNLICLDEMEDFNIFHTQLRQLLRAMKLRKDKAGLRMLMDNNDEFRHLDADTVEAMSVMLHLPEIWNKRENYMSMNEDREEYDMCQAMREICEEERNIGFSEGMKYGIEQGVDRGIMMTLIDLVKKGLLDMETAAGQAGMAVADFSERMDGIPVSTESD